MFQTFRDEGSELRRLAVRGAGVTVFSQVALFAIQMVATVILARLLTPSDFGLVTMVTTFSLLLTSFGLNGFTEAIVQREDIDHFLASNLFWINLSAGLLLTIAFAGSGSLLAGFYGDRRIAHVAAGMSVTILTTSLSVLHLALLRRAMHFTVISLNDIVARAASVIVTILLGWAGWGYWALVVGAIALPLSTTIGAWSFCRWAPSLPRRACGTASMVRFATNIYGRFSVNYFARNLDNLLVGWRFGAQSLGFYKKAYDLFALSASQLTSPLTSVAVAALSRLNGNPAQYRRYLLRAMAVVAFVGMGLGADLTLIGNDVIRLLLGPGWESAGRIFAYFGPGIGVMLLYNTHGWIHLSIGRADRWFRWGIVEFAVTALLFALGLRWGPEGIAVAWTASFWLLSVPALRYAGRPAGLGIGPMIAAVWKYLVASMLAGLASAFIIPKVPYLLPAPGSLGAFIRIVTISMIFGTVYLLAVALLHGGPAPLRQVAALIREMVPWGRFSIQSVVRATSAANDNPGPAVFTGRANS